jgi:hypothetical protein
LDEERPGTINAKEPGRSRKESITLNKCGLYLGEKAEIADNLQALAYT